MSIQPPASFSQSDLERIAEAVQHAESITSGEVVPCIVLRSDPYEESVWKGGLLSALLVLAGLVMLHRFSGWWWSLSLTEFALAAVVGSVFGMIVAQFVPTVGRFLAGKTMLHHRVAQRAAGVFLEEEVFRTRERTGILVFVSLFEHEVVVIGDSGINAKVRQEEWDDIVQAVVVGIQTGKPVDGLVEGIRLCGELLQKHGFAPSASDSNELPDTLRTGG